MQKHRNIPGGGVWLSLATPLVCCVVERWRSSLVGQARETIGEVPSKMPPNGVEEWRARIGHWENRKLRWYQAHCGSRPRVPLHLHLERVISEARPMLCVLLLLSLSEIVATSVCETGNGALSSLNKLVGKARCCMCVRRSRGGRVWAMIPYSLCLALCLLLVVAGDVETNPGPISGEGKHCSIVLWSEILVTKRPPN